MFIVSFHLEVEDRTWTEHINVILSCVRIKGEVKIV